MIITPYYTDTLGGQTVFRCAFCPYDSFSPDSINQHCRCAHAQHEYPESQSPIVNWIDDQLKHSLRNYSHLKVGLCLLTWNTEDASFFASRALINEQIRLKQFGIESRIYWVDNHSTDGTVETLKRSFRETKSSWSLFKQNLGQSIARNDMVNNALHDGCDYVLFVDGDVEVLPFSPYAMLRYLEDANGDLGCIGMYSRNCSHVRDYQIIDFCRRIDHWMVTYDPQIAWTNYGMFRRAVLEKCKFEENGPFAGPGWGFEDDDYQFQMTVAGYRSGNTKFFRYLHRRMHSSIKNLGLSSAAEVHRNRKAFLLKKWANIPQVQIALNRLANQTMPVLDY